MDPTSSQSVPHTSPVQVALQAYDQELARIKNTPNIPKRQILRLLLVRDAIESKIQSNPSILLQAQALAQLSELDNTLLTQAKALVKDGKLADCRRSRQPEESAWWWWLETYLPATDRHRFDRFDWVWNILSASSLVVSASFLTITAQAFSTVGGFDLLQTVSTLSQATGLVLVAGGALTNRGRQLVKKALQTLNIPTRFHSEVTLAASLVLLLVSISIYHSLPKFSNYYYQKGLAAQQAGNLYVAVEFFKESIAFDPEATAPHNHLAEVYQNLEKFQEAQTEYQDGLLKGDIVALNGMGALSLAAAENLPSDAFGELSGLLDAEVLFRIGLNKVDDDKPKLKAALHRNLGITLMKRSRTDDVAEADQTALLTEATQHFQASVALEQTIASGTSHPGQGIAYCYIAAIHTQNNRPADANEHWQLCQTNAYPSSLEQYEDILRLGSGAIGLQLNTKHILESGVN